MFLHEMVEIVQIIVGKHLRSDVAYRKTAIFGCSEEALVGRQPIPIRKFPLPDTILRRVVENNLPKSVPFPTLQE